MTARPMDRLGWMRDGTALFLGAMRDLDDVAITGPTRLDGWTGKHLLAHVAANAEALGNLVHWARTGQETPMYSSTEQRNRDIENGAARSAEELRDWVDSSARRLDEALENLTDEQWGNPVRTAQGRAVDATEIPWMRAREVMIHAVDLAGPIGFSDLPGSFLLALVDDIVGKRSTGGGPAIELSTSDGAHTWTVSGTGAPSEVRGDVADLAAYLAGRPGGQVEGTPQVPALPRWL